MSPSVVVFDVNETLSDMTAMAGRFGDVGAPEILAKLWFAGTLRDGFAVTSAGGQETFSVLAEHNLRLLLAGQSLDREMDLAVEHIMSGFMGLPVHNDVPAGIRALREAGLRMVTLSNGSSMVADRLLTTAGVRDDIDHLLSVEEAGVWKPVKRAYEYAARMCGTELADMVMVAAHPWDIDGAARAGMQTAFVNRTGMPYPPYASPPTYTVDDLRTLADALA